MHEKYCVDWDQAYEHIQPSLAPVGDELRCFIENNFGKVTGRDCIEIGCYPGTYLSIFGQLGYRLHGIDSSKYLSRIPQSFRARGYECGDFVQSDFLNFEFVNKFDIVCSFGFVEHFDNYHSVIEKMCDMVDVDGCIIITVPNFRGVFQNMFHSAFDSNNYLQHNIEAMNLTEWRKVLEDKGFDVSYCGGIGKFDLWINPTNRSKVWVAIIERLTRILKLILKPIVPNISNTFSPYLGIIAKRR